MTPTVFIVDDDEAVRTSLSRLVESVGLAAEAFPDAASFLAGYDPQRPGCLLLDIRMPGMTGLELQERLAAGALPLPVIIISAHGDVEAAVRAMKAGAVDFLRKPYDAAVLLERVRAALAQDVAQRRAAAERAAAQAQVALLTPREREVMLHLVAGKTSKQIAYALGLSRKTVDIHRSHIMLKLRVDSVVDLVRIAGSAGLAGGGAPGAGDAAAGGATAE